MLLKRADVGKLPPVSGGKHTFNIFSWRNMYTQWDDEKFGVGLELFDDQHKTLLGMINKLHDGMKQGHKRESLGKVLVELMRYTMTHFSNEESLMKEYGYPAYEEHFKEHQRLLTQVQEFKSDFDAGIKTMTVEVMGFLVDWLLNHIAQSDRQYVSLMKENGVV